MSALAPALILCGIGLLGMARAWWYSRYARRTRRAVAAGVALWRAAPQTAVQDGADSDQPPLVEVRFAVAAADEDAA